MTATAAIVDFSSFAKGDQPEDHTLELLVEGMHCAACAWRIESELNGQADVEARINLTAKKLLLHWHGSVERGNALVAKAAELGYRFMPFEIGGEQLEGEKEEAFLLRCIAVAGFASGNLMMFSFALWFSSQESMGVATRDLMHWFSALVAIPAIVYAGQPYYTSAWRALKHFHTNMDVPISVAVLLASGMSVFETLHHGEYAYFDSSTMLLFFLLIGRYLDRKARGKARSAAQGLLAMMQGTATIREADGQTRGVLIRDITPGMQLMVATGEKIAADGVVSSGVSEVDSSLLTGETIPTRAAQGQKLFAGMINLTAPLELTVSAASEQSLLADIVRLMDNATQGQAKYVRIADTVAGYYTPVVHILAAATFVGWLLFGLAWQKALLIATTVLIITCPCALGLAVPVVQVVASGRLFKHGILVKSGDALERLASIDHVIFDKTGTLTLGKPQLLGAGSYRLQDMQMAASLAVQSNHPLSRAIASAWNGALLPLEVEEVAGDGLRATYEGKEIRLGRREWCGDMAAAHDDTHLEMWLSVEGEAPVRFAFSDMLRSDAKDVVKQLQAQGLPVTLLSGDRASVVEEMAAELGITDYAAGISPLEKTARIEALMNAGNKVLMVGDGLNDAPALTKATVSLSPSSAIDITQNAADMVFQGDLLSPVLFALTTARTTLRLVKQNFALSFLYNICAIPLAVTGYVTPLIAAMAMSSSSLIVVINALRLNRGRP